MLQRVLFASLLIVASAAAEEPPPLRATAGEMVENITSSADPTQSYTLYLPTSFDNTKKWPVLLIFDPRGRSVRAAEIFREAADRFGWILVSSDNTRSDGPWEPNIGALNALWPEIHDRLPVDPGRVYATGFSGGASVAYLLASRTGEIAGIIACGGRYYPDNMSNTKAAIFATAGQSDFNNDQMHLLAEFIEKQRLPGRLVFFEGAHSWMPAPVATEAVAWMELIAMQRGLREVDEAMVDASWKADLEASESLFVAGRELEAVRRLGEMERSYEGLRDLAPIQRRVEEITKSREYRSQSKASRRARAYWRDCRDNVNDRLMALRTQENPPRRGQLERELAIENLLRRAERSDEMGLAAQQCLGTAFASLSFYIPRELTAEENYAGLAVSYELALKIREGSPVIWYNLACARARLGRGDEAMAALEQALDRGFNQPDLMHSDSDLDSLRKREDFIEILDR